MQQETKFVYNSISKYGQYNYKHLNELIELNYLLINTQMTYSVYYQNICDLYKISLSILEKLEIEEFLFTIDDYIFKLHCETYIYYLLLLTKYICLVIRKHLNNM